MTLVYIFDYDDTLKSMQGPVPSSECFKEFIYSARKHTSLPLIILTAGMARGPKPIRIKQIRPADYADKLGLKVTVNVFDRRADVCVFDIQFMGPQGYSVQLIDTMGTKNLGALSHYLRTYFFINPNMVFIDDLSSHSIESAEVHGRPTDGFVHVKADYICISPISPTQKGTDDRIRSYTKMIETRCLSQSSDYIEGIKFRGNAPLLDIVG